MKRPEKKIVMSLNQVPMHINKVKYYEDLEKYCDELEKALDKVCDLLVGNNNKYKCDIKSLDDEGYVVDYEFTKTKEEWKEWSIDNE